MAHVLHRLQHLPAPVAAGGEYRGASAAVFLRDQQRQLGARGRHFRQHQRARFGLPGFLKIHQVGQLFPALDIGVGIVFNARDQAVAAGWRQFRGGGIAMEGVLVIRQANGQQIGKRRFLVAAIGQRRAAAQEQQAAAAAIDKLLDQILLRGGEIVRFDGAENDALVAEQIVHFGRETVLQLACRSAVGHLHVELVLGGADYRVQRDVLVVFHRAADEFEVPARLAFHVQNARLGVVHVEHARQRVVVLVLFLAAKRRWRIAGSSRRHLRR